MEEEEEGVEAPHPSHLPSDLWPSWPRGVQNLSEAHEEERMIAAPPKSCQNDQSDVDRSYEQLHSSLRRCHKELLARLDSQDAILRQIQGSIGGSMLEELLTASRDLAASRDQLVLGGLRGELSGQLAGQAELSFSPEVFHTFTEADLALRAKAAAVEGSVNRQLFAGNSEEPASKKRSFWDRCHRRMRKLVSSHAFDMFFALVVVSNSLFMGIEVEFAIQSPDNLPVGLEIAQYLYAVLFTIELTCRVGAFGFGFFYGPDWVWAWLDLIIVLISLAEIAGDIVTKVNSAGDVEPSSVGSFTGFKAFRLIRITRLLKTLRMVRIFRFIMALRTLVTSIVFTLRSLFWALTLLVLIVYVFSILLAQAVHNHMLDPKNPPLPEEAIKYFSSLSQTMLSLFMSISGGVSWEELVFPLQEISSVWVMVLLFYVSFTYFAVLNVVTGVFCQSAIDSAQNDHANIVHAMLANKEAHIEKISSLFSQLGAEKTGVITYAMFEEGMNTPAICEYFETLGLDVWDAWSFFKLLDMDRGGAVEIGEFFKGCLRLRGQARGVDVGRIMHDQNWLIKNTGHFQAYMEVKIKQLTEMMSKLSGVKLDNNWSRSPSPE